MIILIDMDDTMEQLLRAWLRAVNKKYNRNAVYDEVRAWDVSKAYPGLTHDQVYGVLSEPGFWKTVEPMPDAPQVIRRLMDRGHEVFVVTASTYDTVHQRMEDHLFRHFPFLSPEQVIITFRKQLLQGDILIDDGVHNLEGGSYKKILVTAPYNEDYDAEGHGMIRVNSWKEIEAAVLQLEEEDKDETL